MGGRLRGAEISKIEPLEMSDQFGRSLRRLRCDGGEEGREGVETSSMRRGERRRTAVSAAAVAAAAITEMPICIELIRERPLLLLLLLIAEAIGIDRVRSG